MNLASLFNLEAPDILVILIIVLFLFGAKRLRMPRDRFDRPPQPADLFNVFASVLLFLALTVFFLALTARYSH